MLRCVLEEQQQVADILKREQDILTRYVFGFTKGKKAGQRITESGFSKARRKARVDRAASLTIVVGQQFATSCGPAYPSAWPCS